MALIYSLEIYCELNFTAPTRPLHRFLSTRPLVMLPFPSPREYGNHAARWKKEPELTTVLSCFPSRRVCLFFSTYYQRSGQSTAIAFFWRRISSVCCLVWLLYPIASSSFSKTLHCGCSFWSLFLAWLSGYSFLFSDVGRPLLWWFTCIVTLCTGGSSKITSLVWSILITYFFVSFLRLVLCCGLYPP